MQRVPPHRVPRFAQSIPICRRDQGVDDAQVAAPDGVHEGNGAARVLGVNHLVHSGRDAEDELDNRSFAVQSGRVERSAAVVTSARIIVRYLEKIINSPRNTPDVVYRVAICP